MNIDKIYFAQVNIAEKYINNGNDIDGSFVKYTVVKQVRNDYQEDVFFDLQTGYKYSHKAGYVHLGNLYIEKLVPYTDIIPVKEQNMSRRKVLKKFNEYRNQKNEEE